MSAKPDFRFFFAFSFLFFYLFFGGIPPFFVSLCFLNNYNFFHHVQYFIQSLEEANYRETAPECERKVYESSTENQPHENNIQNDSHSPMVVIKEEYDYIDYFSLQEEMEEGQSPPIDVLIKEDKIAPEDLWMMKNKAENFDNKMVIIYINVVGKEAFG